MDPTDKELLIRWRPQLVEEIDIVNGLLTHLQSRKVLNSRMIQNITYNKPPDRQVEELLDLLPKRGANAFRLFCESLNATDQEDVVNNYLQGKDRAGSAELNTDISLASDASSIPASPSSLGVSETANLNETPAPVPVASSDTFLPASALSSSSAYSAAASSAQISASLGQISASSSSKQSVPQSVLSPAKRRPDGVENDDRNSFCGPSETDSSPLKRHRAGPVTATPTSSGSFICIGGGGEGVIKIYNPSQPHYNPSPQRLFQSGGVVAQETAASASQETFASPSPVDPSSHAVFKPTGVVVAQESASRPAVFPAHSHANTSKREEVRYNLKHFIMKDDADERQGQDVNLRLAENLLKDLPRQYLDLLSAKGLGSPAKLRSGVAGDMDFSQQLIRERLSRCDSTDTMDPERSDNQNVDPSGRADTDQPDQSSVQVPSVRPVVPALVATGGLRTVDYTDGPIQVQVDKCTRQFYNDNRSKSYRMVGMPRGQALIINVNEVFNKPPRRGTDIDRDNLQNLLIQMHFQVTVYNDSDDLTAQGMVNKLNEFVKRNEHASADACIICLLSHGEEGYMFGTDGRKIALDEIFMLFDNRHCPALLNKPKVFFIQACRGGLLDHGVKAPHDEHDGGTPLNNNVVQHPSMSDMLICYPTLQGYYAWRNREKGSWYIEAVVKVFMKYAKEEDICAMLNRVNSDVSRKVSRTPQQDMDRMSQMSEFKSSLRKPYLFFFPGIGAPSIE